MGIEQAIRGGAAFLAILLFGQACTGRAPRPAPTAAAERAGVWRDVGDFSVGVDLASEEARRVGADVANRGLLAIHLSVVSRASGPVTARNIQLEGPDGARLFPLSSRDVAGPPPASGGGGGAGASALCGAFLPMCAVAVVVLVAGLVSLIATPAAQATYQQRVQEYEASRFPSRSLDADRPAQGFVFFRVAESTPDPEFAPTGVQDYRPPSRWQAAIVMNMAGASAAPPFVLHVDLTEESISPGSATGPAGEDGARPPAGPRTTRVTLPIRPAGPAGPGG